MVCGTSIPQIGASARRSGTFSWLAGTPRALFFLGELALSKPVYREGRLCWLLRDDQVEPPWDATRMPTRWYGRGEAVRRLPLAVEYDKARHPHSSRPDTQ
jgi:hypothetical protein